MQFASLHLCTNLPERRNQLPTRNTVVLMQIIEILGDLVISPEALARLEKHFKSSLIIVAGDTEQVAKFAEELRLAITKAECETVLDYIGNGSLSGININQVEDAINALFD